MITQDKTNSQSSIWYSNYIVILPITFTKSSRLSYIVNFDQLSSSTYVRANLFFLCYNVSLYIVY